MTKLEELAYSVAIAVPAKPDAHQAQVSVPLWIINEIRAELEKSGFNWRRAIGTRDALLRGSVDALSGESSRHIEPILGVDP